MNNSVFKEKYLRQLLGDPFDEVAGNDSKFHAMQNDKSISL
jgi:hypothetical protein